MVEFDVTFIGITLIAVIGIIFTTKVIMSHQGTGSKYLRMKMKEMEDVIDFQKKQVARYKAKAAHNEVAPRIEADLETDGSIESVIPQIIAKYGSMAPAWMRPLLNTPGIAQFAIDMAKEHPEEAKNLLSQFVGKKNDVSTKSSESGTQSSIDNTFSGA